MAIFQAPVSIGKAVAEATRAPVSSTFSKCKVELGGLHATLCDPRGKFRAVDCTGRVALMRGRSETTLPVAGAIMHPAHSLLLSMPPGFGLRAIGLCVSL